jgi:peptide/nickel transport system permease protein
MTDQTVLLEASEPESAQGPIRRTSKGVIILRRFLRNRMALVGTGLFLLIVLFAIIGPFIAPYSYSYTDFLNLSTPPDSNHWFGTDTVGGDLFARTVRGLQRSLMIGVVASVGATVIAAFLGSAAAYFEGWTGKALVWIIDMLMVIPPILLLAMVAMASSGNGGWLFLSLALMFINWVPYSRILRSIALSLRDREYVMAAKFMGVRDLTIIRRHLIPNLGSILVIHTVLGIVYAISTETGLSFLGFGVKPPDVSLGVLIKDGAGTTLTAPWQLVIPSLLLVALLWSLTLIGDGLRDALDPSSQSGGKA